MKPSFSGQFRVGVISGGSVGGGSVGAPCTCQVVIWGSIGGKSFYETVQV